jgi:flagellar biosynthesis GTPase FlhF
MKLEYITVDSIKSGMKEVAARFGADAVLVKAIADGDKQKLLIAHDNQVRMSSPLPRSESQQSVEQKLNEPKIKNKDVEHSTLEAQIAAMKERHSSTKPWLKPEEETLSLSDIDLVTGERRVRSEQSPLTSDAARSIQRVVSSESLQARLSVAANGLSDALPPSKSTLTTLTEHPEYLLLTNQLDSLGISSTLRKTLLDHLENSTSECCLFTEVADFITNKLPDTREINLEQHVHFLAGAYGVGKSSLAFKMALQINSQDPGRALVVNYSSDQTASWINAETMGARLGIDVVPASSPEELSEIIHDKSIAKLLLVDVSTYNERDISALRDKFFTADFHLVAPSDTCLSNLQRLSDEYSWDSLMITRLDSLSFSWGLYQVLINSQIPLSIGTNNSRIDAGVVVVGAKQLRGLLDKMLKTDVPSISAEQPELQGKVKITQVTAPLERQKLRRNVNLH